MAIINNNIEWSQSSSLRINVSNENNNNKDNNNISKNNTYNSKNNNKNNKNKKKTHTMINLLRTSLWATCVILPVILSRRTGGKEEEK